MTLRSTNLRRIASTDFDTFIVGGGINGAVSAAALAARGASVAMIDRGDFGGFTSQASSNLVWGGFKYLENYEFLLVRKLCVSRNRLIKSYPDNIKEIRFLASLDETAPYSPAFATLGTAGYWAIGSFATKPPAHRTPAKIKELEPIIDTTSLRGGIEYSDAYLKDNDARFVFGFARAAMNVGAAVANYVELAAAERTGGKWNLSLLDRETGETLTAHARILINAAGPHADAVNETYGVTTDHRLVFSKGIHLVVPRLGTGTRVLAFFDDTERLFYVIPMGIRSVIGTTDTRTADPTEGVTDADRRFLLDQINARLDLEAPLTTADIISERVGVRPLVVDAHGDDRTDSDWTALSRKHVIETDPRAHVITIFGGKLTDCLNVGEEVADQVERLGVSLDPDLGDWFGEPSASTRDEFLRQARLMGLAELRSKHNDEPVSERLWRRYGLRAFSMLEAIRDDPSMANDIMENADYLRVELHLAATTEMVTRLEDFLKRRSKIALVVPHDTVATSDGLFEACQILFGEDAHRRMDEYFGEDAVHDL